MNWGRRLLLTAVLTLLLANCLSAAWASPPEDGDYTVEIPRCEERGIDQAMKEQEKLLFDVQGRQLADLNGDGICDLITLQDAYEGPERLGIPKRLKFITCIWVYDLTSNEFKSTMPRGYGCSSDMNRGSPQASTLYYNKIKRRVEMANPRDFYAGEAQAPFNHDSPLAWFHFRIMIRSALILQKNPPEEGSTYRHWYRRIGDPYLGEAVEMWNGEPPNPTTRTIYFADFYPKRWLGYANLPGLREKALKIQSEEVERVGGVPFLPQAETARPASTAK